MIHKYIKPKFAGHNIKGRHAHPSPVTHHHQVNQGNFGLCIDELALSHFK
jgi:hypothetical protein